MLLATTGRHKQGCAANYEGWYCDKVCEMGWEKEFQQRELLTKFCQWLEEHHYLDCDWWAEEPGEETAVDRFLEDHPAREGR